MTQVLDAIYEHGTFRLVAPAGIQLAEGQPVRIIVEADVRQDILELAAQVYAGLSDEDIVDVERTALDRGAFFTIQPQ